MNHTLYIKFLPIMVIPSTAIGFITGLSTMNTNNSFHMFSNWIGYTSIGIMTGIAYPISFPMLAGYVVYKNQ